MATVAGSTRDRSERWMLAGACLALSAALLVGAYDLFGPRRTPAGQPPLERITAATFPDLRREFNAAADQTRILALFSPT